MCDEAFWNHKKLWAIKIPNSVTTIGKCAFYDCIDLTSMNIPNSVTKIWQRGIILLYWFNKYNNTA